jgi:hypothetical protein
MARSSRSRCVPKTRFAHALLIASFFVMLLSPCTATVFTGSISRSDPPNAVLVARFNFKEYTESKYSVQASNVQGFFAIFDDEDQMLYHLEKGLSSTTTNECMSYLMDGKGVGSYRALPPAQLQRGWTEGILGHYCRDWFFVFFNCQASLEVPSYRIETLTSGGDQLPCGKENLPALLLLFAALPLFFSALMLQKHGRDVLNPHNSCCIALCSCTASGVACLLMATHYYVMRSNGTGVHAANFTGRITLQAAQLALLIHALRFTSFISLPQLWSIYASPSAVKTAIYCVFSAYAVLFLVSVTSDSSETIVATAQPLNACGRLLPAFQLIFAAFTTHLYRRARRLEYADASIKLNVHSLALTLPWLWALPLGTLACLSVGLHQQLVAVYAVQLSLSTVYSIASTLVLVDYVVPDDPQLFDEPRLFDDGL